MSLPLPRRLAAEGVGTFFLVLIGPGAMMVDAWSGGKVTHVGVALAFTFVVTAVVAALGPVSGAHINPAVSIALGWRDRAGWRDPAAYVAAQLLGAVAAAFLLAMVLGPVGRYGATLPAIGTARSLVFEFVMSLALGIVAFRSRGALAPLAVGITVGFCALVGGPLTGASMNPARSFGPALAGQEWGAHWVYWAAPLAGMFTAALFDRFLGPRPVGESA